MSEWFGAPIGTLLATVALTIAFYISVIVAVRIAGRRTVAQISSFDFVITVAIGSLLATTVVAPDPSYARGLAALITLLAMQVMLARMRHRFPKIRRYLDFSPKVVATNGKMEPGRGAFGPQLTEEELASMLRRQGFFDMDKVHIAILEPGGQISVIPVEKPHPRPSGE